MVKIIIKKWFEFNSNKLRLLSNNPYLDLEILLLYVIKKTKEWLIQNLYEPLFISEESKKKLDSFLNMRIKGEPLEYILEQCEFWSLPIKVKKRLFIPRPVTELLVTQILSLLDRFKAKNILEFGTGTGVISLAINKEFNNRHNIIAIDNDILAINCASHNSSLLKIKNISFILGNWYQIFIPPSKFDFIISNPPYVDHNDLFYNYFGNHFESYKTTLSLANGYKDLFQIIHCANKFYIKDGGWLILEHGWDQATLIKDFMLLNNFTDIFTKKDYNNNNRITVGKKRYI